MLAVVPANATVINAGTLSRVQIGATFYDVNFFQDDSGSTSFDDVFGATTPNFAFTNADDALVAINAVFAAGMASNFDFSPFTMTGQPKFSLFLLPYATDPQGGYEAYSGFAVPLNRVFGPISQARSAQTIGSFAILTAASVPEPSVIILFCVGFALLVTSRRYSAFR
jgi:hypothetical protein